MSFSKPDPCLFPPVTLHSRPNSYGTETQQVKGPATRKTLWRRFSLLAVLFLVAGSVAYPQPANWAIDRWNEMTRMKIGHVNKPVVLGLDLQGGTHLEYVANLEKIADGERDSAMSGVRDVIERRVNQMGVSEPIVQTAKTGNQWRLTVELAGVRDVKEAIRMIGETPILDFREQNPNAGQAPTDEDYQKVSEENAKREEKVKAALARVKGGEPLETVARETSEEAATAQNGGDLGWILEKQEYAKLLETFQGREPGLYDGIIDNGLNFYVAELLEKKARQGGSRASHLLVQWKDAQQSSSTSTKEEARAKIEKIKTEITPENFDEMARRHSEEPGADQSAGDLDWFRKGMMVQPFEEAAYALQPGGISEIIETPFGFHILKLTGSRDLYDVRVRGAGARRRSPPTSLIRSRTS